MDLPTEPPPRDRWLTADEIQALTAAAAGRRDPSGRMSRVERFLWIGLETGSRRKSIQGLSWARVDLDQGFIDFRTPGKTQTKKRQVPVPISDRLKPIMRRAWEERKNDLWVLDHPGDCYESFVRLVTAVGLKDVTPHTLRHTCATHMARSGAPIWVIAQVLGDDPATVAKNYLHHDPSHLSSYLNFDRR
jgi:integrase